MSRSRSRSSGSREHPTQHLPSVGGEATPAHGDPARARGDGALKAESLLLEAFRNAATSARDAKQARASLFNLFLLAVGLFVTWLGGLITWYKISPAEPERLLGFVLSQAGVTALMSVLSFAFFAKSLELRWEYRVDLEAMDAITAVYITELKQEMPRLERAFRHPRDPERERRYEGILVLEQVMAVIGSFLVICAAVESYWAVRILTAARGGPPYSSGFEAPAWVVAFVALGAALAAYLAYFRRVTRRSTDQPMQLGVRDWDDESGDGKERVTPRVRA